MASITIRNLAADLKARLRVRAARHGRSMEEEARTILRHALGRARTPANLAQLSRELFGRRGIDLEPHPPVDVRRPPGSAA